MTRTSVTGFLLAFFLSSIVAAEPTRDEGQSMKLALEQYRAVNMTRL